MRSGNDVAGSVESTTRPAWRTSERETSSPGQPNFYATLRYLTKVGKLDATTDLLDKKIVVPRWKFDFEENSHSWNC